MLKDERHDTIIALCDERGSLTVREAAKALGISDMTARRDFDELAAQGLIARVYGGARSVSENRPQPHGTTSGQGLRPEFRFAEKRHAAELACGLIREGDAIFLGSGTTVEAMVSFLPAVPLRIVTINLAVFGLAAETEAHDDGLYELHLVGGKYHKSTMTFTGPQTYLALESFGLDKAFVGVNGIVDGSAYGHSPDGGYSLRLALDAAERRYLITDSSKIGKRDFNAFYKLEDTTAVITDGAITKEQREELGSLTTVLC